MINSQNKFDWMGALSNIGGMMQSKIKQDEQNALATAYARNPAYMQAEMNLQDQAMLQAQQERELAKQDALRKFAQSFSQGGISPTGINPSGQGQLNDALSKYAQITGDPTLLLKQQMEMQNANLPTAGGATGVLIKRLMDENPNMTFADALAQVQTGYRQGVNFQGGVATPIQGLGQSMGKVQGQTEYGKKTGGLQAELEMKPTIEQATQQAQEIGKERGVAQAKLESMTANMPKVEGIVNKLRDLAKVATYTTGGKVEDFIQRQLGLDVGDDARARAEFNATVSNEVLPLLRETFGAAFTVAEGESLRATLGSPDLSPSEKLAELDAFIRAKRSEIQSLGRREGVQGVKQSNTINALDFLNE